MAPENAPSPSPTAIESIYRAYASELPLWFRRLGVPPDDVPDAAQDLWLTVGANPEQLPADVKAARDALIKLTFVTARRAYRHAQRSEKRHAPIPPEDLADADSTIAEQVVMARELFDAIDQLDERQRSVFIQNRILGVKVSAIAAKLGLDESTVRKRIWAASAQLQRKLGYRRKDDDKKKMGVLIAPAALEIRPEVRAAFCAIWAAEGRLPGFGGPKDPPPPPPPFFSSAVPAVSNAAKAIVSRAQLTLLVLLLLLMPIGLVALYYFWDPTPRDNARTGLRVPQIPYVGEINDVVDAYPAAQAPAAPSARASAPATKSTPKASRMLDEDALQELELPGLTRLSGSE